MKRLGDLGFGVIQAGHVDASDARSYGQDREEGEALPDRSDR
jgi:hypothetical protein